MVTPPSYKYNFYPRSPCGERRESQPLCARPTRDFYPRSPCGERLLTLSMGVILISFLSTLSLRRATSTPTTVLTLICISIHALLAESDVVDTVKLAGSVLFLSTLSLRRATRHDQSRHNVNRFLSTLSLRRATFNAVKISCAWSISIHALLAESDRPTLFYIAQHTYFYPRSPCGERLKNFPALLGSSQFLSTLSLRRATAVTTLGGSTDMDFYPRSPCGERPKTAKADRKGKEISIHALLAESDLAYPDMIICTNVISIHALLAESDAVQHP